MQANCQLRFTELTEQINQLIKPLMLRSSITFFAHLRQYSTGQVSLLSNNAEWHSHCLKRQYKLPTIQRSDIIAIAGAELPATPVKFSVWLTEKESSPLKTIYQELQIIFNIELGITLSENQKNYCDYFLFASDKGNINVLNDYFNNISSITTILDEYKQQATLLLNETNGYFLENATLTAEKSSPEKVTQIAERQHPLLSKRELECALHCKEGKTAKETANILNLSRRTVEYYLEKVKIKLDCNSKYQLITKLYDYDITKNYTN